MTKYGYSSARVKAMESYLLGSRRMEEIMNAKDTGSVVAMLYQEDYKEDLEEFGGVEIQNELIDFALSRNLARRMSKLRDVAPTTDRRMVRNIVSRWDLSNIKLAIEAKARKATYESISRYIIDVGRYNRQAIKEAMAEEGVDGAMAKIMLNSPYADILRPAFEEYKKGRRVADAINAIDSGYYKELGNTVTMLRAVHQESALMLKIDIDVRNLMLLIKAKRVSLKFSEVEKMIAEHGTLDRQELSKMYENSKDLEAFVESIKVADLQYALDAYRKSRNKELLVFEIALKNSMLRNSVRLLGHSILSFGTILGYSYLKEIEVAALRIIIQGSIYGLSREERDRLIVWKKN